MDATVNVSFADYVNSDQLSSAKLYGLQLACTVTGHTHNRSHTVDLKMDSKFLFLCYCPTVAY